MSKAKLEDLELDLSLDGVDESEAPVAISTKASSGAEPPKGEGFQAQSFEVNGFLQDSQGNRWAISPDKLDDLDELGDDGFFARLNLDPNFAYMLIRHNQIGEYRLKGWVIVMKAEVGLSNGLDLEYGKSNTGEFSYADSYLIKTPKVYADRAKAKRLAKVMEVYNSMQPTPEMLARATQLGSPVARSLREAFDAAKAQGGSMEASIQRRQSDKLTQ